MSEANKAISRRIFDIFSGGDLSILDEVLADSYVDHNPFPGQAPGREGVTQIITDMRAAFPDLQVTQEDQIAEGDKVVTRWSASGTHQGDFQGIPPTGKRVDVSGIVIDRIAGGQIVDHWEQFDSMSMMIQLGAIPAPGQG